MPHHHQQKHDPDKIIQLVQSSTRSLMNSFRDKTDALRSCSKDVRQLIREGYHKKIAYETANRLVENGKSFM
ncbi:MAG TPA: hypothetical protein VJP79_08210 [Nitrososphaera sp.]|nr:hypothetical protein [Nitrososphaera sp.]